MLGLFAPCSLRLPCGSDASTAEIAENSEQKYAAPDSTSISDTLIMINRPFLLFMCCVLPGLIAMLVAQYYEGPLGRGIFTGGGLGLALAFLTGLITHWCYIHRTPMIALASVVVTMSLRFTAVFVVCLLLHTREPEYFLSSVLTMTALLVLALLSDAVFLALPSVSGLEEAVRG